MKIEIDQGSGFCFGVTRAINKAEEELARASISRISTIRGDTIMQNTLPMP